MTKLSALGFANHKTFPSENNTILLQSPHPPHLGNCEAGNGRVLEKNVSFRSHSSLPIIFVCLNYLLEHKHPATKAKTGTDTKDIKAIIKHHFHLNYTSGFKNIRNTNVPFCTHEIRLKHAFFLLHSFRGFIFRLTSNSTARDKR